MIYHSVGYSFKNGIHKKYPSLDNVVYFCIVEEETMIKIPNGYTRKV